MIIMMITASLFLNNQTVKADTLETGLYIYTGYEDNLADETKLEYFTKNATVTTDKRFSFVYVTKNGENETRSIIQSNNVTIPEGLTLTPADNDKYVTAKATQTGKYTVTYSGSSADVTLLENLEPGFYLYRGSSGPADGMDLDKYYKEASVTPSTTFGLAYVEIIDGVMKRTAIKLDNASLSKPEGLQLTVADFDNQFMTANAANSGKYKLSYNGSEVTITFPEKFDQGLYIYTGNESPIDDPDFSHYTNEKELSINKDYVLMLVYVDENGSRSSADPGKVDKSSDLIITNHDGDKMTFRTSKAGDYVVKYKKNNTEITNFSVTLKFSDNDDDEDTTLASYKFGTTKYYFGLVDWTGESTTENAFMVDYRPIDQMGSIRRFRSAFVGTKQQQANKEVAPQNIMDSISDLKVELDPSSTIDPNAVQIVRNENEKISVFGVSCDKFELIIDANYAGKAIFKTTFNLHVGEEVIPLTSIQEYEVIDYEDIVIYLNNDQMSHFEDYFNPSSGDSYGKLEGLYGKEINRKKPQNVIVVLPEGEYEGMYHINMQDFVNANQTNSMTFSGFVTDDTHHREAPTRIRGGFVVNGGRIKFEHLDMVASSNVNYNDKKGREYSGKKVGMIAEKNNTNLADISWIMSCSFSDYDYAVISTETGVVAACSYNYFKDNDYGFYMNCDGSWFGTGADGNFGNVFVNSKTAAVALISTPSKKPFNVLFNKNLFFNNVDGYDFYVEEDGTEENIAGYLMMYNYYGKTLNDDRNSVTADNTRPARVNYGGTRFAIVYTNPCLMFPLEDKPNIKDYMWDIVRTDEDPFSAPGVLGLDNTPGLFSCAMNNVRIVLNGSAKNNVNTFEILEINDNGVNQIGGFRSGQR